MRHRRLLCLVLIGSASAAGLSAGIAAGVTHSENALRPINARIAGFAPRTVTVAPGALVRWRNVDGRPHNAVSLRRIGPRSAFRSGDPVPGNFQVRAPRRRGSYSYICAVHPLTMRGTVIVRAT